MINLLLKFQYIMSKKPPLIGRGRCNINEDLFPINVERQSFLKFSFHLLSY